MKIRRTRRGERKEPASHGHALASQILVPDCLTSIVGPQRPIITAPGYKKGE